MTNQPQTITSGELKHIRTRFPGVERSMGAAIHDMANYHAHKNGEPIKRVHGWIEVTKKDPDDQLANKMGIDWIAYIHARVEGGSIYTVPIVPDEFNPRASKIVRPEDTPHVFKLMHEAEEAANKELPGFVQYIEGKL